MSTSMDFTPEQEEVLTAIRVTEAVVAVLASSAVVFSFARFPELRKPNFALVFWLCVADIGANVAYSVGAPADGGLACIAQGVAVTFFDLSSVWWTFLIGYKLYRSIVKQEVELHTFERTLKMHALVWGSSFVAALLPLTTHNYGDAGAWCWISADSYNQGTGTMWRFAIFYVPIWCVAFATSVHYYAIIRALRGFSSMQHFAGTAQQERLARLARQLQLYPLIFVVSWTMITIVRVYNTIKPHQPLYWLTVLQVLFSPMSMQAVLNTVAYGMGDQVKARWIQLAQDCKAQGSLMPLCCADRGTPLADTVHLQDDDGPPTEMHSPPVSMQASTPNPMLAPTLTPRPAPHSNAQSHAHSDVPLTVTNGVTHIHRANHPVPSFVTASPHAPNSKMDDGDFDKEQMLGSGAINSVGTDEDDEQGADLASTKKDLQEGLLGV